MDPGSDRPVDGADGGSRPTPSGGPIDEASIVFNVVLTGSVFAYLGCFVVSQLANCGARFRLVCNGCPPEEVARLEAFARRRPDRIVEVLETSEAMVPHGTALDAVFEQRDDGDHFCFVDPDILATGPYLRDFLDHLEGPCAAVTSGRGVWRDDDVVPEGMRGVSGEYFYSPDGFLFGSPHFALYRRAPLAAMRSRWGIGFHEAGPKISDEAKSILTLAGFDYLLYDTGKLTNTFLQVDGHELHHFEHPSLVHIGGVSHYLAPPKAKTPRGGGEPEPDWARWAGMSTRFEVARFTAATLRALCEGGTAPAIPDDLDPSVHARLVRVQRLLVDLVDRYGPDPVGVPEPAATRRERPGR